MSRDAAAIRDVGSDPGVDAGRDASLNPPNDAGWTCDCPAGEVYRNHACVPTVELGCAAPCDPAVGDCGEWMRCDPCGAASSCGDDDCHPACVQEGAGTIARGDLRIWPTWGPAHAETEIVIHGHPWTVAALYYSVWITDGNMGAEAIELSSDGYTCTHIVRLPAWGPGAVPVYVSQYGGGGMDVLAGIFTYVDDEAPDCIQPGFPCTSSTECCKANAMMMGRENGRCTYIGDLPVP